MENCSLDGTSLKVNDPVYGHPFHSRENQQWQFVYQDSKYFKIKSYTTDTVVCLTDTGTVLASSNKSTDDVLWSMKKIENTNKFVLINKQSEPKVLQANYTASNGQYGIVGVKYPNDEKEFSNNKYLQFRLYEFKEVTP